MADETSSTSSSGAGASSDGGQIPPEGNGTDQSANGTAAPVPPDASSAVATRGDESAAIVNQGGEGLTVAAPGTGGVGPRQAAAKRQKVDRGRRNVIAPILAALFGGADADRVAIYHRQRTVIVASLVILFGGAVYLIVRQTSYPSTSADEWFAGDTAAIGLIAAVVALAAAAFAYPTFLEWRDQISGPDLKMTVQYRQDDGTTFADLPEVAQLMQNRAVPIYPVLRIVIDNSGGRVPLRDGRLAIYVQAADNGNHAPYVSPKPLDGKAVRFETISDVSFSGDLKVPATLLTTDSPCPPRSTSYFVEGFEFQDDSLNLIIVLTGSNLRVPKTEHYKVNVARK